MADDGDGDTELRKAALLMSALVMASDGGLSDLIDRRGIRGEEDQVGRVRDLVREIARRLVSDDEAAWEGLEDAWTALLAPEDSDSDQPEDDADDNADEEASDGVVLPPTEDLLSPSGPPPSVRAEGAPSPWVAPTRSPRTSSPVAPPTIRPPPPASPLPPAPSPPPAPAPIPPPLVPPPVTDGEDAQSLAETNEDDDERPKTLPPTPMLDDALPFASLPNPETPDSHKLPADALAHVMAGLPPMTLVSYAAFAASWEALPKRRNETLAKFGVTNAETHEALERAWRTKLDGDERLERLCDALREQFTSWLRRAAP